MKTLPGICTCLLAASAATSLCARAATPAPLFKTSFDCTIATAPVEKLICRDAQLARMDRELNRLYRLALTDERSVPRPEKVITDQKVWMLTRNHCFTEADPKVCAVGRYAERAHQLRQGSAIVRTKDPDRLTQGPLAIRCAGLNALIAATYFNAEPGVVYLRWANTSITLNQEPARTGLRYSGKDNSGYYSFSQTGDDVLFQKPGSGTLRCRMEPTG
ncbi:MliC family protein [Pseudomonas violetae]|uniref:MliC family protein n=1 Tax=Pseudomonas violetae TaxID=2915813 RepID=A0ABT0EX99_9PSED|nr:MliC family protein [Pseudomonas violetae]MCK1790315.1 MliC family protein [Pseudomonas violetae]